MSNQQLSLPYEEITTVKGRTELRKLFKISSREGYKIPFEQLQIREGFNKRFEYEDMESLVAWIVANTVDGLVDLDPPLTVDVLEDDRVFIMRGHRRYKGIQMAIEQGLNVTHVVCYVNSKEISELDRLADIYSSNMHQSKLKLLEQVAVVFDMKHNFGEISNEDIGKHLKMSRQKVDQLLLIAEADDAIKNQIRITGIGITEACEIIRRQKKSQKDALKKEEESHKTPSSPAPAPKDELAGEMNELEELEKPTEAEEWWNALPPDVQKEKMAEYYGPDMAEIKLEGIQHIYEEEQAAEELKKLLEVSDEIKVREETLPQHIGRKLSAAVVREWTQDFMNQGEPDSKDMSETIAEKNTILTEDLVAKITGFGEIDSVFLYKQGMEPVAQSVITVAPEVEEKSKYDMDRPEIQQVQNIIKLADKIEGVVSRLECANDQTKEDLAKYVQWLQKDAGELREWVHTNKKQNKRGS